MAKAQKKSKPKSKPKAIVKKTPARVSKVKRQHDTKIRALEAEMRARVGAVAQKARAKVVAQKARKKVSRPKNVPLPGLSDPVRAVLDPFCERISEIREALNDLRAQDAETAREAQGEMRTLGVMSHRAAGVELVRVPGEEKLRVRTSKAKATAETEEAVEQVAGPWELPQDVQDVLDGKGNASDEEYQADEDDADNTERV